MKILKIGSRGPSVQLLQLGLNRAGYGPLATDGIFGPETAAAVKRFQRGRGLAADGAAGSAVQRAMRPGIRDTSPIL
jgi:peptidoglycan hydrolase-like protein with peptidoglycan-binding domain